ncbi:MAG: hypothetical protein FRX49_03792 [Trebouxia sp. A1-2]|nr:MAG: hypothetical protein FRX49_03792 [Trebouxia sp. A1-2]
MPVTSATIPPAPASAASAALPERAPTVVTEAATALRSIADHWQGESELPPRASGSQGPWLTDQCEIGVLRTSPYPPQLVTTRPHVDAAGQLQSHICELSSLLTLDQHESACQSARPLQQSKTGDRRSSQELTVTEDQQLMMLCQLPRPSHPRPSADDLLCRLNSMGSGSIIAKQVAEGKDLGRNSSACKGRLDSHNGLCEGQMMQLFQNSIEKVAELL